MKFINSNQIKVIVAMRGFAALSVVWFHITRYPTDFLNEGILRSSGMYGRLGVEIFFIISGFIIPWSLYHANYKINNIIHFIAKRIIRICPTYFFVLAIGVLINYITTLTPWYHGTGFKIDYFGIFLHILFLKDFFSNHNWINPVFWTLAIEVQYYVLIAITFSLVSCLKRRIRIMTLLMLSLSYFIPIGNGNIVINYIPFFLIGIVLFQKKIEIISNKELWLLLFILLILTIRYDDFGIVVTIIACISSICILYFSFETKISKYFGEISYSLYLVHFPISMCVLKYMAIFIRNDFEKAMAVIISLIISVGIASLIYIFIEKPSMGWSKRIKY